MYASNKRGAEEGAENERDPEAKKINGALNIAAVSLSAIFKILVPRFRYTGYIYVRSHRSRNPALIFVFFSSMSYIHGVGAPWQLTTVNNVNSPSRGWTTRPV